jgi:hypothetical protein
MWKSFTQGLGPDAFGAGLQNASHIDEVTPVTISSCSVLNRHVRFLNDEPDPQADKTFSHPTATRDTNADAGPRSPQQILKFGGLL